MEDIGGVGSIYMNTSAWWCWWSGGEVTPALFRLLFLLYSSSFHDTVSPCYLFPVYIFCICLLSSVLPLILPSFICYLFVFLSLVCCPC